VTAPADPFVRRLERDTLVVLGALVLGALAVRPTQPRLALGVLGGGLLMAISYWGVRSGVDALVQASERLGGASPDPTPEAGPGSNPAREARRATLSRFVKFFTRHAILALAAYAMIARLHLDPIGMLAGVTSPGIAAVAELIRAAQAARHAGRGSGGSRSS
jgi:hypothetical protein